MLSKDKRIKLKEHRRETLELEAALAELPEEKGYRRQRRQVKKDSGRGRGKKGTLVLALQILASFIFLAAVLFLNVLPFLYVLGIILILALLASVVYVGYRRRRKKGTGIRVFSLLISLLLLVGSFYVVRTRQVLGTITKDQPTSTVNMKKDSFTIYISGIDVYGDIGQKSRSDVNILAVVNPQTHKLLLVNTPRDYYVELPEVSKGRKDKLTHAGIYGIQTSMATLSKLYDTPVDFYTRLNFTSMIDIVDSLGGIKVDSEVAFTTSEAAGEIVAIKKGSNHLNGKQALAFSRERHNLTDGDNQRGRNQQAVITGVLKKAMSPAILFSANGILNTVSKNTEVAMGQSQLQQFIKTYLNGGSKWQITSVQAAGTGANKYCYSYSGGPLYVTVPDATSVANIKAQIQAVKQGK